MVYIPKNPQKLKKTAASKYRNKKVKTSGITFDSIGERNRWLFLRDQQKQGKLKNLMRQAEFILHVNGYHICNYVADFMYETAGTFGDSRIVVEDFKGVQTDVFKLKKNLMMACHGVAIRIVKSPTEPV